MNSKQINDLKLESKIQAINSYQLYNLIPSKIIEFLKIKKGTKIGYKVTDKKEMIISKLR